MSKSPIAGLAREIDADLRAIRLILRRPLEADIARGALTGPQQNAMRALLVSGGMSLKDLSRELGLAHSTASGIVDRLEKRGLVSRETAPDDLRFTRIVVTDQVRDYVRHIMPALELHPLDQVLRSASPAERAKIAEGVRALRSLLEASAPIPDPSD
jgi:DNA-binding MarR family transcriptional regulator